MGRTQRPVPSPRPLLLILAIALAAWLPLLDGGVSVAQTPAPAVIWLVTSHSGNAVGRYDAAGNFLDYYVAPDSGGLDEPRDFAIGLDGNLYVVASNKDVSSILQYAGASGAFLSTFASGNSLDHPYTLAFGPPGGGAAGYLFAASQDNSTVSRFDATTGAAAGVFIAAGTGGLANPRLLRFSPGGDLLVVSQDTNSILRFKGSSGEFIDAFVTSAGNSLSSPVQFAFGPDGNLYVGSEDNNKIIRFNGTTGAHIDTFIDGSKDGSGLSAPSALAFGPLDGALYVGSRQTGKVLKYDGTTGAFLGVFIDDTGGPNGTLVPLSEPEFAQPCLMYPSAQQAAQARATLFNVSICPFTSAPPPVPTPTPSATPSPTPKPTQAPSPTPTPAPTVSPKPGPSLGATPPATPLPSRSPKPSAAPPGGARTLPAGR